MKKYKFKWQYIPLIIVLIILICWLALEFTGVLDFENILEKLDKTQKVTAATVLIALLALDIFIPIPSTIIMPLGGTFFGIFLGTLIISFGSMLASIIGYWIGRTGGRKLVWKIISEQEIREMEQWSKLYGKWPVILAKTLPMMAETVSISAGIAKMRFSSFFFFTLIGTIATSFAYVAAGQYADTIFDIIVISIIGFLIAIAIAFLIKKHIFLRRN